MNKTAKRESHYGNDRFYYNPVTQQCSNVKTSKDDIYFQSRYEFRVYREILQVVPRKLLGMQRPLRIKPSTNRYPAIQWKIDFSILPHVNARGLNMPELLIEAKGLPTREFKRDIQYAEYLEPDAYSRLILVSETELDFPDVPCIKLIALKNYLASRLA
jgi:hypothetical protein